MDISKFHHYLRYHSLNWYEQTKRRFQFNKKKQAELLLAFAKPMSVGRTTYAICSHIELYGEPKQKIIVNEIRRNLQSGDLISKAFIGWYDPMTVAALSAAEKGGDKSFLMAMNHIAKQLAAEEKTGSSSFLKLLYPGLYWLVSTIIIIGLNAFFIPMITSISNGATSPAIEDFSSVATFYTYWLGPILVCMFVGFILIKKMLQDYVGPYRDQIDTFTILKWQPFAGYRLKVGAYIVSTFSLLKRFGLSAFDILRILGATGSKYQRFHVENMIQSLKYGNDSDIDALNTGLLESQYISLLKLYTAGNDSHAVEALASAADDINERCIKRIQTTGNIIFYAFWGAVLFNLIKVASLMLGMNS